MVDVDRAIRNRGELHPHTVTLVLSDDEWIRVVTDANEIGVSVDLMLSLVCAFSARARINGPTCLALADILQHSRND